jgi:hypothetical protein
MKTAEYAEDAELGFLRRFFSKLRHLHSRGATQKLRANRDRHVFLEADLILLDN